MNHLNQKNDAVLVLEDGTVFWGSGIGVRGVNVGELCFNTAMTGYQEIITDLSYAGQIIVFTFPHIGNVGVNDEDIEADEKLDLRGVIMREIPTAPSNWRATESLNDWLVKCGIIGIASIDTRKLTKHLRKHGFLKSTICFDDNLDLESLQQKAMDWEGLNNKDCASSVSTKITKQWGSAPQKYKVIAFDYGIKQNILRLFSKHNCSVEIVPANSAAENIIAKHPDGIFLSNGPGDPAATGAAYAIETIQKLIAANIPIFGICLGHQLLALALGAKTQKMHQGHHGANHPVKNLQTQKVEITSMNHGWAVARESLPENVKETHTSLFDNTNCGLEVKDKNIFSVQYHPEASPGPMDSQYLFQQFCDIMKKNKL